MAKIYPTIENINRLKVQPTDGERFLINHLIDTLPDDIEIYFQPFLNGDMPDIILMQKNVGVTIIEVKDWNLSLYKIDKDNKWYLKKNNGKLKSPFQQVYNYKHNMFNLHINGLLEQKIKNKSFYGKVNTYVYFHHATKKDLTEMYDQSVSFYKSEEKQVHEEISTKGIKPEQANAKLEYLKHKMKKFQRDFYMNAIARDTLHKLKLPKKDDTSKLFTDEIYIEFQRYLQPPTHTINEGIEIKYTKQQENLVKSKPENIKIKGVAGSGKTVVLAKRAVNAHKRHNDRVLILTYNITLKRFIHDKISDVRDKFRWDNFYIINYHEFFKQNANRIGIDITIPKDMIEEFKGYSEEEKEIYFEKYYYSNQKLFTPFKNELKKYKTILIDEIQDYKPAWIKIIRDNFLDNDGEIVLFGDEKQNIYHRAHNENTKIKTVQGFGEWKKLTKPIRQINSGDRIVDLSVKFQKTFFNGRYEVDSNQNSPRQLNMNMGIFEVVSLNGSAIENVDEIVQIMKSKVKSEKLHPNDVSILASRLLLLRQLDHKIRKTFNERTITTFETLEMDEHLEGNERNDIKHIRNIKKYAFNANNGMMKLATIHSFKGYESPTVFLILRADDSPELVYAAITRSKFNLMVFIENKSNYTEFFTTMLNGYDAVTNSNNILEQIQESVENKNAIDLDYRQFDHVSRLINVKPYKTLFLNGNLYVACEVDNKYKFSMLRVSRIENVFVRNESFVHDIDILDFISHIQTPFSRYHDNYRDYLVDVLLNVDKSKAKFFLEKKFLASQEIVEEKKNGDIVIKYIVTHESEVEELIKKWIPYIQVIEPLSLDEKIRTDLERYLYNRK